MPEDVLPWGASRSASRLVVALVRHGRTAWNEQGRFLGLTDIPLDTVGQVQARELGTRVSGVFDAVWSSPLVRAWETARCLSRDDHGCGPPRREHDLRELAQGHLEGLEAPVALSRYPEFFAQWAGDPAHARVPGGETLAECHERAWGALQRMASLHRGGEVVAAVTHQMVIASLCCAASGCTLAEWRRFRVRNAALSVLEWDGSMWTLCEAGWPRTD